MLLLIEFRTEISIHFSLLALGESGIMEARSYFEKHREIGFGLDIPPRNSFQELPSKLLLSR